MVLDFNTEGNLIGIELLAPEMVTLEAVNGILKEYGLAFADKERAARPQVAAPERTAFPLRKLPPRLPIDIPQGARYAYYANHEDERSRNPELKRRSWGHTRLQRHTGPYQNAPRLP